MHHADSEKSGVFWMRLVAGMRMAFAKGSRKVARIVALLLIGLFICSCALHIYSWYAASLALSLLAEATAIKIGSSEEAVLSLIARYGGTKWYPSSSPSGHRCNDKGDCPDVGSANSHSYDIRMSPFQVFSTRVERTDRFHDALAFLMGRSPNYLREPLGLRDWLVIVNVHTQDGRVAVISGNAFVEGRNGWLGNSWKQSSGGTGIEEASSAYSISMGFLHFPPHGGSGLEESLTPLATVEQVQSSFALNDGCFTGLIPCASLCDFKPSLFRYLNAHPEIRSNFPTGFCSVPQP